MTSRTTLVLRTAQDIHQGNLLTAARLRAAGLNVTNQEVREAPAVICTRKIVRDIVAAHPEITAETAVDLDVGDAVLNTAAIHTFWEAWPQACFVTEEQDNLEAIDLVARRLKR